MKWVLEQVCMKVTSIPISIQRNYSKSHSIEAEVHVLRDKETIEWTLNIIFIFDSFLKEVDIMGSIKMPKEIIDSMAQAEADALLEGLNDKEMRKNPAFIWGQTVLKDNDFITTTETDGVKEIVRDANQIPDLVTEEFTH